MRNAAFIVVDDLRPQINAYGHSFMHTPHMDALAANGTLFQKAYVQYSFCAPSRNSFMTGRRPDATRVFSFTDHFREAGVGSNWTSLPQYFRQQGYAVYGVGKMYHPGLPPSFDARSSWDNFTYPGNCAGDTNGWPVLEKGVDNVDCPAAQNGCDNSTGAVVARDSELSVNPPRWCALNTSRLKHKLEDQVSAAAAVDFIERRAAADDARHFFLGVGFRT